MIRGEYYATVRLKFHLPDNYETGTDLLPFEKLKKVVEENLDSLLTRIIQEQMNEQYMTVCVDGEYAYLEKRENER